MRLTRLAIVPTAVPEMSCEGSESARTGTKTHSGGDPSATVLFDCWTNPTDHLRPGSGALPGGNSLQSLAARPRPPCWSD
jgi:hypothetical protein